MNKIGTNDKTKYTGTQDVQCNVYDMASNIHEFTTETYSNINSEPYIIRGDCYENESGYTSYRSPSSSYDAPGFRPILYI